VKINEVVSDCWAVQPEPGSVADQLIRKGEARGEVRGEIRLNHTLQSILRVPQTSNDQFAGMSPEQLRSIAEELQQQILNRPE
jgi:hypothetical protein